MIIVKLQGGLGNQMFQYAAARSLINSGDVVFLDKHFFKKYAISDQHLTARKYELDIFKNIKAEEISPSLENFFNSNSWLYKLRRKNLRSSIKYITQHNNEYVFFGEVWRFKYVYLDGYFQSGKYFKHIRTELLNDFCFPPLDEKNKLLRQKITGSTNAVSIHIRRGDYLKPLFNSVHGVTPLAYYYKALDVLKTGNEELTLFVFSDDINWVKENFKPEDQNIYFADNNNGADSWKDMALMSACKHHIIANSSFSWWAAWLSGNKGKIFAPFKWLNPEKVKFDIHDFIPQDWNIIQYE